MSKLNIQMKTNCSRTHCLVNQVNTAAVEKRNQAVPVRLVVRGRHIFPEKIS